MKEETRFKRKIYNDLLEWKKTSNGSTALLIEGARRIGKSTICDEFGKNEYDSYLIIDFSKVSNSLKELFEDDLNDLDTFFSKLFIYLNKPVLKKGSLIVFDEVQFCPYARQAIKHLIKDGRYHYIETGSLISIKENVKDILIPSEEEHIDMFPMDYEEFLWALDKEHEANILFSIYKNKDFKLCSDLHEELIKTLRVYVAIGGMPQAIAKYIETKDYLAVEKTKQAILNLYKGDLRKLDEKYKTICEIIYDQIPSTLCHENTRFKCNSINQRGDSVLMRNSIDKLVQSKMVNIVYKTNEPKIGFKLTQDTLSYKLYINDTGLFTSLIYNENKNEYDNIYKRIIFDKLESNLGMLFENLACQFLLVNGHKPYYYSFNEIINNKLKKYEIDFITYVNGKIIPIEIKSSRSNNTKSLDRFKEKYSSSTGTKYVINNKPLKQSDNIMYLPFYIFTYFKK